MTGNGRQTRGQRTLTAVEAEEDILRISQELDDLLSDLAAHARAKAMAEHAYGLKKARETLVARTRPGNGRDGNTTVDERDAYVKIACDQEWLAHLVAETLYEVDKERIHAMRSQLSSLQTICANLRAMT